MLFKMTDQHLSELGLVQEKIVLWLQQQPKPTEFHDLQTNKRNYYYKTLDWFKFWFLKKRFISSFIML